MIIFFVRFIVFAAIYVAAVLWWAGGPNVHSAVMIVGLGSEFSGGAATTWVAALALRRIGASPIVQLIIHVASVVALFSVVAIFIAVLFLEIGLPPGFDFMAPFSCIVAVAAFADAAVGFWQDRCRPPCVVEWYRLRLHRPG